MGLSFENRDGRTYVYNCSSTRVSGKSHPVSSKEYIGVLNEQGMVQPKPISVEEAGTRSMRGASDAGSRQRS